VLPFSVTHDCTLSESPPLLPLDAMPHLPFPSQTLLAKKGSQTPPHRNILSQTYFVANYYRPNLQKLGTKRLDEMELVHGKALSYDDVQLKHRGSGLVFKDLFFGDENDILNNY
jgi:hypothetical protein